ncbi:unnamed protein product, partial [Ectocarpus sp. 6 AP-2014]
IVSFRLVGLASVKTAARRTSSGTSSSSESQAARIHRSIILRKCSSVGAGLSSGDPGMCVSPDLQCVLWATEGREGVYLLAVDNLGGGAGGVANAYSRG